MKLDSTHFDTESFMEANGMLIGLGGGGLGLLAISWVWAAVSSFQIATRLKTRD
jgi:cell division protein FtsX